LLWWDEGNPTRLLVWRDGRPFDEYEQTAILRAASREVSWAAPGPDSDQWKVRFIPLDHAVSPPPGFDHVPACIWESMTPYVPPRHYLRGGKLRARESVVAQVKRELVLRGLSDRGDITIEEIAHPTWVGVHIPQGEAVERTFVGDRRGYWIRLCFAESVQGPIRLGHSASFGLGLFRPTAASL
jgi:CRISPR-associated protein Csb2